MKHSLQYYVSGFRILPIALLLPGFPMQAGAPAVPLLLAKYPFEELPAWIPDWGGGYGNRYRPVTGWKSPFRVLLDSDDPHSGMHALRMNLLESADGEKILHSPAVQIGAVPDGAEARQFLRVRLFVRSSGLTEKGAGIRVLERDGEGRSIGVLGGKSTLIPIPDSPDWVELNARTKLHSRTASILLMLVVTQTEAPATVWVDDISVERLTLEADLPSE